MTEPNSAFEGLVRDFKAAALNAGARDMEATVNPAYDSANVQLHYDLMNAAEKALLAYAGVVARSDMPLPTEEINNKISAWFEPKPEPDFKVALTSFGWIPSKLRSWRYGDDLSKPIPLDWDTDEAANARLLEVMAKRNAYVWIEWDINEWCVMWKPTTKETEDCSIEYSHADRKTAIVLAFLKFAGIEVTGE